MFAKNLELPSTRSARVLLHVWFLRASSSRAVSLRSRAVPLRSREAGDESGTDGCRAGSESRTDEEARRHGKPTRAAGGSASLGLVAGARGVTSPAAPAGSCCCCCLGCLLPLERHVRCWASWTTCPTPWPAGRRHTAAWWFDLCSCHGWTAKFSVGRYVQIWQLIGLVGVWAFFFFNLASLNGKLIEIVIFSLAKSFSKLSKLKIWQTTFIKQLKMLGVWDQTLGFRV